MSRHALCTLSLFASVLVAPSPFAAGTPVRRLALVAGANQGSPERARLRFAVLDAERFAQVMTEMGGVSQADSVVLKEPGRAALLEALALLRTRVLEAQPQAERTEVVFYFSGHADEAGLLLGRERVSYRELREALAGLRSDVGIAILDACASGAITRIKGGESHPAFLSDVSSQVRGRAFLTSSSESEAAQESDQLRGSFFTHALVSGLRGAADVSGDGKVTFGEAYQFAFHETLDRTATTQGGSQHPAYDIQMAGTGDVVLTDLRETSATIVLGAEFDGRFFVRDAKRQLVAELNKPAGRVVELGLEPGDYEVQFEQSSALLQARITLVDGQKRILAREEMHPTQREATRARGDSDHDSDHPEGPNVALLTGRSRLDVRFGVSDLEVSSTSAGGIATDRVTGGVFELGYGYWARENVSIDLTLVGRDFGVTSSTVVTSTEERVTGAYGGFFGARIYPPMRGSIRLLALGAVGVLTDFLVVETTGPSNTTAVSSSDSDFVGRLGGGAEARMGHHASVGLTFLATFRNGHTHYDGTLGFSWTFGHGH